MTLIAARIYTGGVTDTPAPSGGVTSGETYTRVVMAHGLLRQVPPTKKASPTQLAHTPAAIQPSTRGDMAVA